MKLASFPASLNNSAMKFPWALLAVCLVLATFSTQSAERPPDWENPAVVSINKEPDHCTLMPFAVSARAVSASNKMSPTPISWREIPLPSTKPIS